MDVALILSGFYLEEGCKHTDSIPLIVSKDNFILVLELEDGQNLVSPEVSLDQN